MAAYVYGGIFLMLKDGLRLPHTRAICRAKIHSREHGEQVSRQACHFHQTFNMLNNFVHVNVFFMCTDKESKYSYKHNVCAYFVCKYVRLKMTASTIASSVVIAQAVLEDQLNR